MANQRETWKGIAGEQTLTDLVTALGATSEVNASLVRPANTTNYDAGDAIMHYASAVKQKETITVSGAAAVKQKETITITGSAAVKQKETLTLTGTVGFAIISETGGLTKPILFSLSGTTDLTQTASDFVTTNSSDYLVHGIVLTSSGADLVFEASVAGTPFDAPVITTVEGDLSGTIVNTQSNVVAVKQKDTITITGTSGGYTINHSVGNFDVSTFTPATGDILTTTQANQAFVTAHAAAYLGANIVLTSSGADLIFEASTAGTGFTTPTTSALPTSDLDGTVVHTAVAGVATKQKDTLTVTGTNGWALIDLAGGISRVIVKTGVADIGTACDNFVAAYAADYLAQNIVLTSFGDDLIFEATAVNTPFVSPRITNIENNLGATIVNTQINVVAVKQKDTLTLTGNNGQASITQAGGLTKSITILIDKATAAAQFVSDYAADYAAQGIVITSLSNDIIFESDTAGVSFTSPVITNVASDLSGTIDHTTANLETGTATITGAGLSFVATFNTNLDTTASDFATAHAAAFLTAGVVLTSGTATIIMESSTAGTPFTAPTITNLTGDLAGTIDHTAANVPIGTATLIMSWGSYTVTFDTDANTTTAAFKTANVAAFLTHGLVLDNSTNTITIEANVAGVPFTAPTKIDDVTGTCGLSIVHTTANATLTPITLSGMSSDNGGSGIIKTMWIETNVVQLATKTITILLFKESPFGMVGDGVAFVDSFDNALIRTADAYFKVTFDSQFGGSTRILGKATVGSYYTCDASDSNLYALITTDSAVTAPTSEGEFKLHFEVIKY